MEPLDGAGGDVIQNDVTEDLQEEIFESEEEMKRALSRLCYGDLYIIGSIWIHALRTVLVGANFSVFPVVEAAPPPETPQKPPKMRYKDLPIYKSPHSEYKDHLACKDSCPEANEKMVQKALFPHVKNWRKKTTETLIGVCAGLKSTCKSICSSIDSSKKDFKKTMRDPNNLQMRQGVVASGTLLGYLLGGGGGIPKRVFFTSIGALATGALCFPKETDEAFRNVAYHAAKTFLAAYNGLCRKNYSLRERIPCREDLPPEPKPRKPLCAPKKERMEQK